MGLDVIKEELESISKVLERHLKGLGRWDINPNVCCIGVLFGYCNKYEVWTKVHLHCTMSIDLPNIC
jgi:hypothetical protein